MILRRVFTLRRGQESLFSYFFILHSILNFHNSNINVNKLLFSPESIFQLLPNKEIANHERNLFGELCRGQVRVSVR